MKDGVHRAVGERLRSLRVAHGLTLQELSTRLSDAGVDVSEATLNRVENGRAMLRLDTARSVFGILGTSLGYIEEVIAEAQSRTDVDLTGKSADELVCEGQRQLEIGDYHKALSLLQAARDRLVLEEEADRELLARALILESDCQRRLRRFQLSLNAAKQVLNLPEVSVANRIRAVLLYVAVNNMSEDFFQARLYADYVEPLLEKADPKVRAYGLDVLGFLYFRMERFQEAVPRLETAKGIYDKLKAVEQASRVRVNLGYCFFKTGHTESALSIVRRARDDARRNGYMQVTGYAMRVLGRMAAELGDYEVAQQHISSAASLARKLRLDNELFICLFDLWRLYVKLGDKRKVRREMGGLRRLLSRVDSSLPEAREFLATASQGGNRRAKQ